MKPLKLKMEGFGPYLKPVEIDFRELSDSLTLISGNTGAGKTTVFDAICCALFGSTSGSRSRSFGEMRSKNASDKDRTEIDFTFELRGETYQVTRRPSYKKGENKTDTVATAELVLPDGNIIRKVKVVNDKIREILGIGSDEFKQIVMIAQNDFMSMVKDTGGAQEKTFNRIFDATLYKSFSDRVKEEQRSSFNKAQNYINLIKSNIDNSGLTYEKSVVTNDYIDTNYILKKLEIEKKGKEDRIPKLDSSKKELEKRLMKVQLELHDSEEINRKFDKLEETKEKLKKLDSYKDQIESLEELKSKAERARDIVSKSHMRWKNFLSQGEKLQVDLKSSRNNLEVINGELETNKEKLETFPKEELDELKLKYQNLKEAIPKYQELNKNIELYQLLKDRQLKVEGEITKRQEEQNKLKETLESIQIIDDNELKYKEESLNRDKKAILTNLNLNRDLLVDVSEIVGKFNSLLREQRVHQKIEKEKKAFEIRSRELNEIFIQNNAAYLAEGLEEGKPCPVCGSLEHPNIAVSSSEDVTKEDLEEVNEKLSEIQNKFLDQFKRVQEKKGTLLNHLKQLNFKVERLKETYTKEDNESFKDIVERLKMPVESNKSLNVTECEELIKALRDIVLRYDGLLEDSLNEQLDSIEKLNEEKAENEELKDKKERTLKNLDDLRLNLDKLQKELKEISEGKIEVSAWINSVSDSLEFSSLEEAQVNLSKRERRLIKLESSLKELEESFQSLSKKKNEELGRYNNTEIQLEENKERIEESEEELAKNLEVAEFKSLEDYESSVIDHETLEKIIERINSYHNTLKRTNESFVELSQILENSATRF